MEIKEMSKRKELLKYLQVLSDEELKRLGLKRIKVVKPPKKPPKKRFVKVPISRKRLEKWIHQNLSTKEIAKRCRVSERTITRRIKEYKLKGIRPPGRKPKEPEWELVKRYMGKVITRVKPVYYRTPIRKYINTKDLVCSNKRKYPKGKYCAVCFYYVLSYDRSTYIHMRSIQYREKGVPFKVIREWTITSGYEELERQVQFGKYTLEEIIAYEFLRKKEHWIIQSEFRTGKRRFQ